LKTKQIKVSLDDVSSLVPMVNHACRRREKTHARIRCQCVSTNEGAEPNERERVFTRKMKKVLYCGVPITFSLVCFVFESHNIFRIAQRFRLPPVLLLNTSFESFETNDKKGASWRTMVMRAHLDMFSGSSNRQPDSFCVRCEPYALFQIFC
jgi:hypothetical protein